MKHTPQLEDGYVRIAVEWLEALIAARYPGSVKEFVLAVARETWGWNSTWREIKVDRLAVIMGTSPEMVKRARDEAYQHNLVDWEQGKGGIVVAKYRVQKDPLDWLEYRSKAARNRLHTLPRTSDGVVTSNDAVTSNHAAPANRELRGTLDVKDSKDRTSKARIPAPNDGAVPSPADANTPQAVIVLEAWQIIGLPGKPTATNYSRTGKLLEVGKGPVLGEWLVHIRQSPPVLPEGAKGPVWFGTLIADAANRPWEWRGTGQQPTLTERQIGDAEAKQTAAFDAQLLEDAKREYLSGTDE
jgi:phage replication O-like protein O